MMCLTKWLGATLAIALLASTAAAEDTVANGKVKSINADNKTIVLTDSAGKDWKLKFGDHLVVNRGGKEIKSDLKAGDAVSVCFDKGESTAHYILVQEGANKNSALVRGSVKNYDATKKELAFIDMVDKTWTFPMGDARVRLNMEDSKVENIKTGDRALIIVETIRATPTLRSVMVDRK